MPTDPPPPRRKWHFNRWLIVLIIATLSWSGWRAYAFRSALAEAKALGWELEYTEPVEEIQSNWRAAFKKETWLDGVTTLGVPTSDEFVQHLTIAHRLNPKHLLVFDAATLRDVAVLKLLTRLETVALMGCTGLASVDSLKDIPALHWLDLTGGAGLNNVDALSRLSSLRMVVLTGCSGLTNVDALKSMPALRVVDLDGCTGLTPESVAALKAALPNAKISGP